MVVPKPARLVKEAFRKFARIFFDDIRDLFSKTGLLVETENLYTSTKFGKCFNELFTTA